MESEEASRQSTSDPRLSAADYLSALMHEHESLRAEIQSTISSRNAGLIALAAAIIGVLAKVYPFQSAQLTPFSAHLVLYGLLPTLFLGVGLLQAVATAQTERTGLAVKLVETKVKLLFRRSSGENLEAALSKVNEVLAVAGSLEATPLQWEHLVRTDRLLYDDPFKRPLAIMLSAAFASLTGPILLSWKAHLDWGWVGVAACAYVAVAFAIALILNLEYNRRPWKTIRTQLG